MLKLFMKEVEWTKVGEEMILQIAGSQSSSGYEEVTFVINESSSII